MLDSKELQELTNQAPEAAPTRNINRDVHMGYAAQRPYAALEDRMGGNRAYRTFEEMAKAGADMEQDDRTGDWVRVVSRILDRRVLPDGRVQVAEGAVTRRVALSLEEARAIEGDYWNGWSWVRNGLKVEKEYPENVGVVGTTQLVWKDVEEPQPAAEPPKAPAPPTPTPTPAPTKASTTSTSGGA